MPEWITLLLVQNIVCLEILEEQNIHVSDKKAVDGFDKLSMWEGVLPALESSHAISWMIDNANKFNSNDLIILNVSGRGDKDVEEIAKWKKMNG